MLYNIAIQTRNTGLSFAIGVDFKEVERFISAYEQGKDFITIKGVKFDMEDPKLINIFDVSKRISPSSTTHVKKELQKWADAYGSRYIDLDVLSEFGEDITSEFIRGEWGEKIDRTAPTNVVATIELSIDKYIKEAANSSVIKSICEINVFYYEYLREKWNEFENIDVFDKQAMDEILRKEISVNDLNSPDIQSEFSSNWENELKLFEESKLDFKDYFATLKLGGPRHYLYRLIGQIISYYTDNGYNKKEWNKYLDKRTVATKLRITQNDWVRNLLRYKIGPLASISESIFNAIDFIRSPQYSISMLSERHRGLVAKEVLNIVYIPNNFYASLKAFFSKYNIEIKNPENQGIVFNQILYYPKVRELWESKIAVKDAVDKVIEEHSFSELASETFKGNLKHDYQNPNNHKKKDQLNVQKDIQAFASLLAYKNATPPIAIGLFGNWGSGKSYFMTNLKDEVIEICDSKNPDYCDRIVHVEFNSWFYRDADLWASLVAKVFSDLNKFLNQDKEEKSVESFYKELSSVKDDLSKVNLKIDEIEFEIGQINIELDEIETNKFNTSLSLRDTTNVDLLIDLFQTPEVKDEVEHIEKDLKQELGKSYDSLQSVYEDIDSSWKRLGKAFKIVEFRGPRFILYLILAITVPFICYELSSRIQISEIYKYVISIVSVISVVARFVKPFSKKVEAAFNRIMNLSDRWDSLVEKERNKVTREEFEKSEEIKRLTLLEETLKAKRKLLIDTETQLKSEIEDIKSGKKIAEFVNERSSSSKYKSKLGVISWVREDFEDLDRLIRRQKDALKQGDNLNQESIDRIKIDRIILYIDDLDRCPEDRVIEVLEAVHLLLSFELFSVVVGVDPRWVSQALKYKYKGLIESIRVEKELEQETNVFLGNATTYDYLEKIFQIPFALLPIEEEGAKRLLNSYLEQDLLDEISVLQPITHDEIRDIHYANMPKSKMTESGEIKVTESGEIKVIEEQIESKQLHVSKEEIEYIMEYASIIGDTPRTIQRFVNVYRIIRAHPNVMLPEIFSIDHKAIIGFLAIVIGEPIIGGQLAKLILKAENADKLMGDLIKDIKASSELLKRLDEPLYNEFMHVSAIQIKERSELISRFSFRATELMGK